MARGGGLGCCAGLCGGLRWNKAGRSPVYRKLREAVGRTWRASATGFSKTTLLLNYDPTRAFDKHYKSGAKIAEGGFGAVYHCAHLATKDPRAFKVIQKTKVAKDMEYVLTEIEALVRLDHPNVVKFYEFFEQPTCILVVVELCTAGDFGKLHRNRCPMDAMRPFFRDVTLGLAYCHDLQIVHRDLKFENCLLSEGGRRKIAKVIDFGLSAIRRNAQVDADGSPKNPDEAWLSEALGTKFFVAPEVIDKSIKYGTKCDVWSLGVMLYIMYTNEHPFAKNAASRPMADLFTEILKSPLREEPLSKARVPTSAATLIRNLLVKDPAIRKSAMEALNSSWMRPSTSVEMDVRKAVSQEKTGKIISRLGSWSETSHFDKVVLMLVAHQAKLKEVEDLRAAFMALDSDGNGSLDRNELENFLNKTGHRMPEAQFNDMYRWLDSNENHKLDYSEWLCATMEPTMVAAESSIRELFDFFDSDADGFISREELSHVTSAEEAQQVLVENDTSKDGRIDFQEFQVLMQHIATVRARAG